MNALPNTLNEIVAYASDAVIPESTIFEITAHHEGQDQKMLSEIAGHIQGQAAGELVRHENGKTLEESQFETW